MHLAAEDGRTLEVDGPGFLRATVEPCRILGVIGQAQANILKADCKLNFSLFQLPPNTKCFASSFILLA